MFTAADNADIKVTRTMLQLNGIYRFANDWYAGGGYTMHMSPELDGDGFFEDIEFDDASGFTVEVRLEVDRAPLHQAWNTRARDTKTPTRATSAFASRGRFGGRNGVVS